VNRPPCDENCHQCSGEYCATHFNEPCECNVVERHTNSLGKRDCSCDACKLKASDADLGLDWGKSSVRCVTRAEDMSPDGRLRIWMQDDGDLIVEIVPESAKQEPSASVEFCTVGSGGGRSPHTRRALIELIKAIKLDNAESPIKHSGDGIH
jgi:hypothetical protein